VSKTIIVGQDFIKLDIFALNLKMYVGTETTILESLAKLQVFLDLDSAIDLIIIDHEKNDSKIVEEVYNYLKSNNLNVDLCIIGSCPKEIKCENVISNPVSIKKLVKTVADILGVTASDMVKKTIGEYISIPLNYFTRVDASICDIFVKAEKENGGYQYLLRFEANQKIQPQLLEKYKNSGVKNFFIPAEFRLKFTNMYSEKMVEMLTCKKLSKEDRVAVSRDGMNLISQEINTIGITPKTVEMATACINSVKKTVQEYPKLGGLLKILLKDTESYLYKYCQILTYVMSHIVDKSDWGSEEQKEKLSFVIFFQDMAIAAKKFDSEKLQKIRNQSQLEKAGLDAFEKKIVEQHALIASNLIKDFPGAPIESDVLIKQHHGSHNGIGFPENVSSNSSHLTLILIIAQDFTDYIMNIDSMEDYNLASIITQMKEGYRSLKLKKLVDNLESIGF